MPKLALGVALTTAQLLTAVSHVDADALIIEGAIVYPAPGQKAIPQATLLIQEGSISEIVTTPGEVQKIKEAQPSARLIPGKGRAVVAGLWNSHVHFTEPHWLGVREQAQEKLEAQLQTMLTRYGFTSVVDTGSAPHETLNLRNRIAGGLAGPRIVMASGNFVAEGASPAYLEVKLPELTNPIQAAALTKDLLHLDVEGVKIFTGSYLGPGKVEHLTTPLAKAVVDTAHGADRWVIAHPQTQHGVEVALEAGVDILAHTSPGTGPWPPALVKRLVDANVGLVPTLQLWRFVMTMNSAPSEATEAFQQNGVAQLRDFSAAGGEVLFGTDVGFMSDYDPTEEYLKMQEAGLDLHAILASVTTHPARRFTGDIKNGTLGVGRSADLVVLASDPALDIAAMTDVLFTIRAGQVIYQASAENRK